MQYFFNIFFCKTVNLNTKYFIFSNILKKNSHLAVNACLAPVCSMHGLAVTTVEGIGSTKTKLHPVQERIAKAHGSQCGFCTPGIVMSMYTLLRNLPKPKMADLELALQGNLCRCTGYRPIIEGFKTFTEDYELMQANGLITQQNGTTGNNACAMGDKCCKLKNLTNGDSKEDDKLFNASEFVPYDPSQEPIFPPELKLNDNYDNEVLYFKGRNSTWYRPKTLRQLLEIKAKHPDAKIVVGNTEIGVEVKFKHFSYPVLIQPNEVPEMTKVEIKNNCVKIGGSVTLQNMENILRKQIEVEPEYKTRIFKQIVDMLYWFAGKQIRNVAAVGGNIMTGSPISDLNPIFIAAEVELELESLNGGLRKVKMDKNFFTGYRRNIVKPNEILLSISIPYTKQNQFFYAYKQARRREDDIAIVNSAINVCLNEKNRITESINLAFGGMAPTTITAPKTARSLVGLPWNDDTLEKALDMLTEDLQLSPEAPGGMVTYRKSLTLSFFFRAYLAISKQFQGISKREESGISGFKNKIPKSSQYFTIAKNNHDYDTIGRPIVHSSAFKQASGEAIYVDDIPKFENELYMAFVVSTKAYANITKIDPTEALKMKGVYNFFSAEDIEKDRNKIGPVFHDDEVFISKTVTSQGQTIGIILADDQIIAQEAARKVKVDYEELEPVIISMDDAIKHNSFFPLTKKIENGDVDKIFNEAPHIIEGECRTGGQEQFYFETQCVVVNPKKEDNEMEIFCSTQHPSEINVTIYLVL